MDRQRRGSRCCGRPAKRYWGGGALIAYTLTLSSVYTVRRIIIANLLIRGLGAALVLFALILAPDLLAKLGRTAGAQAIHLHLAFNLCVVAIGLPLLGALLRISSAFVLGDRSVDTRRTSALDAAALSNPDQALACVKRETLRMGEDVVEMTVRMIDLFPKWQSEQEAFIKSARKAVDELHLEIKLYIAQMQKAKMTGEQSRRAMELTKVAGHFAKAGDLVTSNLVDIASRMSIEGLAFSAAGQREISQFHDRIVANLHLALNVLVSMDADSARQLVEEKDMVRSEEKRLQKRHIKRLRKGNSASIETTNLHQEALRTLKQINASFAYVAYPIVEDTGDLLSSRLSVRDSGSA